jgi:predicted nucleic acid-binding protein
MLVVDTNVLAYLWIPGVHTKHAEQLLQKDNHWVAPVLWKSEFRNILTGYIRSSLMDMRTAMQIFEKVENQMQGCEYSVSTFKVMSLVENSSCSAYDCEFVALAESLAVSLVTSDKQILKSFPNIAVSLAASDVLIFS